MPYDPGKRGRRSIRLKDFDYSRAGAYFVTVCSQHRVCLFGDWLDGRIRINSYGVVVEECWNELAKHYPRVKLDAFITMPNHVYGIIWLTENIEARAGFKPAPTPKHYGLSEIIRAFKTFSSRRINQIRSCPGLPVWQRNYYEHIIRNEKDLEGIREYIKNNPAQWLEDENHPGNINNSLIRRGGFQTRP